MELRKITAREYHHKKAVGKKPAAVKVFQGNKTIRIQLAHKIGISEIKANTYKWFVLVPEELTSTIKWIDIFREVHKRKGVRQKLATGMGIANLAFDSFSLDNGSVLFAFH